MKFTKSQQAVADAEQVIPMGINTLSKHKSRFPENYPLVTIGGKGSVLYDVDRNSFCDWGGALGANILGYGDPSVAKAVSDALLSGSVFSLSHAIEEKAARAFLKVFYEFDQVRFAKNGVDATAGAVRLCRAVTGRTKVCSYGYHGYHDLFNPHANMNDGIPASLGADLEEFAWGDIPDMSDAACVILEIPPRNREDRVNDIRYLDLLVDQAHEDGALVILDEIVTGLRYPSGAAFRWYHVVPDLVCMGKPLANGLPLSVITGKENLMREFNRVFFSTTFAGDTIALTAMLVVLAQARHCWEHLEMIGSKLRVKMDESSREADINLRTTGIGCRWLYDFIKDGVSDYSLRTLFLENMVKQHQLFVHAVFPTMAHSLTDVELCDFSEAFRILKVAWENPEIELQGRRVMEGPYRRA